MEKRSLGLYAFGGLNLLHAASHILPAVQSTLMVGGHYSPHHNNPFYPPSLIEKFVHHPASAYVFGTIGALAIVTGYLDSKSHKRHQRTIDEQREQIRSLEEKLSELKYNQDSN